MFKKASKDSIRLIKRLQAAGMKLPGFPDYYYIERTRSGQWQRKAGAWSWFIVPLPGYLTEREQTIMTGYIGGYSSLTDTLKAKAISIGASDATRTFSIDIEPTFTEDQLIDRLGRRLKSFDMMSGDAVLYTAPTFCTAPQSCTAPASTGSIETAF